MPNRWSPEPGPEIRDRPGSSSTGPSRSRSTTSPAGSAAPPKTPRTCSRRPSSRSAGASGGTGRREASGAGSGPSPPARRSCGSGATSTARPMSCTTRSSGTRREDNHLRMDLEAALERLSETSRAVVWLHDVEGYTHEEIAGDDGQDPELLEVAAGPGAAAAPALARGGGGGMTPSDNGDAGRACGSRGRSRATPRPGSIWRAAPSARPSWSGCTSGWPGSRRCRRSGPAGTAGPRCRARFRAERRRRRTGAVAGLVGLAAAASIALAVSASGRMAQPVARHGRAADHQAMARSQALESALSQYNPEGRVLDGRTAGIAQELEDRIARVDRELEMAELLRAAGARRAAAEALARAGRTARRAGGRPRHPRQQRGALSPEEIGYAPFIVLAAGMRWRDPLPASVGPGAGSAGLRRSRSSSGSTGAPTG